ncbi:hypothetical protein H0R92_13810 [Treponema sp. OMZ 840]|uniref:hypothetical protein n=1 Tax=Treponema sp. OMZ 840 TaxID=244313 RepID=UPI003D8DC1F1
MNEIALTPAAQVIVSVIPIVGIVIGGIVVFFYLLWRNTQIKLLIKSGAYKPVRFDIKLFALLTGILLTGVGLVLTVLIWIIEGFSYPLLGGLIPLIMGIGLIVFYTVYKHP